MYRTSLGLKKVLLGFFIILALTPIAASAQSISLSISARQELVTLAGQLVQIINQLTQARALGDAYIQSPAFAQQSAGWTGQLLQIQQRVAAIVQGAVSNPTPTYTTTPSGGTCPSLYRDLYPYLVGDDVASLQRFLAQDSAGRYAGPIHGTYDLSIVAAVQRFQSANGIIGGGDWSTTGFGRIGPATRAAIARVCANSQPIPSTPIPTTPVVGNSTGSLSVTQGSGLPVNGVNFLVTANPNSGCTATNFTLKFGDGTQQIVSFNSSCSTQTQTISHTYPSIGSYTATLASGVFQSAIAVSVQAPNNAITITAASNSTSYGVTVTAVYNPGSTCSDASYTLMWGDGSDRTINFSNSSCSTATKTYDHTYESSGAYVIQIRDSYGNMRSINFTAAPIAAAGAGDSRIVLKVRAEGVDNSTSIIDESPKARSLSVSGNAHITDDESADGMSSLDFDGNGDAVSAAAHSDFNFGTDSFTEHLWFMPYSFPSANNQASLIVQADSSALDSSLGGAGLVLYGNKLYFIGKIGNTTYHPIYNNTISTSALSVDTWYHAAVVRSGNTIRLFLNGTAVGTLTVSGAANASTARLALGRYGDYNGNYFDGWMDNVTIEKGIARWTSNFDAAALVDGNGSGNVAGTYTVPGTYTFTVPSYSTMTVEVWGAGAGGSNSYRLYASDGGSGGASSFGTVVANGGNGNGSGGTASGGDVNTTGSSASGTTGGSAASGGAGGSANVNGKFPGGAGGGGASDAGNPTAGHGGGAGGYAKKTYTTGQLAVGSTVTVVVGAGGGGFDAANGDGAHGAVDITWQ